MDFVSLGGEYVPRPRLSVRWRTLNLAHHEQDDQDQQYEADAAAGSIAPSFGMRPRGYGADQHQDHDDQQNQSNAHEFSPCWGLSRYRCRPASSVRVRTQSLSANE